MKTLTLFLASALVSLSTSSAQDAQTPASLAKFPQLEFKRDADFKAETHNAQEQGFAHPINGRQHIGFRFQTPAWIDGPVEWFAFAQPKLAGEWLVFDAEATLVSRVESQPVENTPAAMRSSIPAKDLKGGAAYTVVRPLGDGESPPDAIAITVASVRGKFAFGDLNRNFELPERLLPAREVLAEMLRIRSKEGNEAGVAYFGEELEKRADIGSTFNQLYRVAWSNAQRGTGRDDPAWGALIFDEIFTRSWQHRYYTEALDVLGNAVITLRAADRHGRAAELLAWWHDAQLLGGYTMDPSAYPDLGPALEFLPEVRRREIPALGAFSQAEFPGDKPRTLEGGFRRYSAQSFIIYAGHVHRSGQWRDAMEWAHWIMELSEQRHKEKIGAAGTNWNNALHLLTLMVKDLGFHEQALQLCETGLSSPIHSGYKGRMPLSYESIKYACLIDLGRSSPNIIIQLENLVENMRANRDLSLQSRQVAEVTLAKAMILHGRVAEGEALLDRLVGENHRDARLARVSHWINTGRTSDVESELIALLHHSRETGNKLGEINLYRMYADFLESQDRLDEALAIRREAVRLCRSFDYFTFLPGELAKLAGLLDRLGNRSDAESAADESRALLAQNRLPTHLADAARAILAGFTPRTDDDEDDEDLNPSIDFQPTRSVVIPVEGAAWSTHLTIANPSTRAESGSLRAEGFAMDFSENADTQVITGTLSGSGDALAEIPLRIEAGTYRLITLRAGHDPALEGALEMKWTTDRDGATATSTVMIEAPESGILSSLIQAGEYRNNPYYGIPILHTYVSRAEDADSFPVRFKTSAPARVEVYAFDGTPLCIDSQGNGSLRDPGDELFGTSDRHGNLSMPLADGEAAFMIVLYPHAPLPEEGLLLDVEISDGETWSIHAQNRLTP